MKEVRINEEITNNLIRMKDSGELIPRKDAINIAKSKELDLIEIGQCDHTSICILMAYDKYCYQQKKYEKEQKAKQVKVVNKEVRFGPQTDKHDYDFKVKQIREFIESKARVTAAVIFKGREINYKDQGEKILCQVAVALEDIAKVEMAPKLEGKRMNMILVSK